MVKLSPKERKSAEALLLSHLSGQVRNRSFVTASRFLHCISLLPAQIGTTIRGEANREVLAGQAALEKKVLSAIEQAEERLTLSLHAVHGPLTIRSRCARATSS